MKRCHQKFALVALFAFLLNVMMPFFAIYNVEHPSPAKEMTALFGEKVLICTGDGFKWVKWADLESGKEKHNPSHYKCPLCYLAAHASKYLFLLAAVFFIFPRKKAWANCIAYDYRPPAHFFHSLLGSRAPPAIFS